MHYAHLLERDFYGGLKSKQQKNHVCQIMSKFNCDVTNGNLSVNRRQT